MQVSRQYEHRRPRYRKFVSPRAGLLTRADLTGTSSRELYPLKQWYSTPPDDKVLVENDIEHPVTAAGKGEDLQTAYDTTIGEAVERYCLRFPGANVGGHELFKATYDEVDEMGAIIDFEYIDIYDSEKHEKAYDTALTRDVEMYWTTGTNLVTGETVYAPAELVWFKSGDLMETPNLLPVTTSGVAAGPSMEFALLAGIHELVERDSIIDLWCKQRVPPTIDKESIADHWPEVHDYVKKVEQGYAQIHLFDFEPEVDIPTIGGIAGHEAGVFPNFMHGSGTDIDLKGAVHQAATEGTQGWPYVSNLILDYGLENVNPNAFDNFEQNVLYYALPENSDEVEFYFEGETVPIEEQYPLDRYQDLEDWSVQERLELAVERLDEADWTPIAFDLTTRDALEAGIRVTRVRCPESVPLTPQGMLPVNHPRFEGVDITTKPHPSP